ncbi:MAG: hypothetical protein IJ607_01140 [Bacteroidaceae bacterium]|nr:hypothetical protein [Bacteroidaceae bacterium]
MNWKIIFGAIGGGFGWFVGEFHPTFPLIIVALVFIVYDAWTAYQLDKRVHKKYPERTKREAAKFTSFAFGKVIRSTIPKRLCLILLAYMVEHWVFVHVSIPLSYIVTGVICFEQAWSILENESSCRSENESRFWKTLQRIMVDKTERHFDVTLDGLKNGGRVTEEQVEAARQLLVEFEQIKNQQKHEDTD